MERDWAQPGADESRGSSASVASADIKVGYRCNNRCVHCIVAGHRRRLRREGRPTELTTDECLALIREAAQAGIPSVILTGGEVTLRADFLDLVNEAASLGLEIIMQTNARAFCDARLAQQVAGKVRCATVAIHGPDAAIHDGVTRAPGSYDQTIAGVRNLATAGIEVAAKVVITRWNAHALHPLVPQFVALGISGADFAFMHGDGDVGESYRATAVQLGELRPELEALVAAAEQACFPVSFEAIPLCQLPDPWLAGEHMYHTGRDGVFTMVGEETSEWNRERLSMKAKGPQCSSCGWDRHCEGVWHEYTESFGTSELTPRPFTAADMFRLAEKALAGHAGPAPAGCPPGGTHGDA